MPETAWACQADSAKKLYDKGYDAQARQDYEKAYEYFKQAYDLQPKDIKFRAAYERNRFLAAASHVHRGQIALDANKLDEAKTEFEKALTIDPSSFIAQQELRRTLRMLQDGPDAQPQASAGGNSELRKLLSKAQGPVQLAPISSAPITLKMTEKSNVIYETVGKLAGVNVLFDPDYTARQVRIELNGVSLEEALSIISFQTKTFWRPVTPNTIFVAQDNPAKRKELEQNVLKTFYLSNLSQPTELQDVVNAMRTILEVSRIQQLPSQGAIVVRGTPDQVALAQKLVDDLDKAKPEVVIDVAIMEVSRDKMKQLGISPPTNVAVQLQAKHFHYADHELDHYPHYVIDHVAKRNQPEHLRQPECDRFPGDDSASHGDRPAQRQHVEDHPESAGPRFGRPEGDAQDRRTRARRDRIVLPGHWRRRGINPLANTQFQYIDVGVNIDITPRIHADHEVP